MILQNGWIMCPILHFRWNTWYITFHLAIIFQDFPLNFTFVEFGKSLVTFVLIEKSGILPPWLDQHYLPLLLQLEIISTFFWPFSLVWTVIWVLNRAATILNIGWDWTKFSWIGINLVWSIVHRYPILGTLNSIYVPWHQILDTPIQFMIWIAESERTFTTGRKAFIRLPSCIAQPEYVFLRSASSRVLRADWMENGACCGAKADGTVTKASPVQRLHTISLLLMLLLSPFEDLRLPSIAVKKIEELCSMSQPDCIECPERCFISCWWRNW